MAAGFTRNLIGALGALAPLLERLDLPQGLASPLLAHARAVAQDSDRLGLLGARDVGAIVPRHTADSLLFALVRRPMPSDRWVDVGSGAGFPGIPMAIAFPATRFTLLEPQRRRAGFLELQVSDLGLANVVVDARRIEEVDVERWDVAIARALADPVQALNAMVRVVVAGGEAIVAVGSQAAPPDDRHVRTVTVEAVGGVDSSGRFFMMARAG